MTLSSLLFQFMKDSHYSILHWFKSHWCDFKCKYMCEFKQCHSSGLWRTCAVGATSQVSV